MNCTDINTAAEILNAFRECKDNPEKEIELFDCLATRSDPPLEAFFEIAKLIKLETLLALTIQAFGKITDPEIKARMKESNELLELLSQKAESGSSDLIRWSAASAIEDIGFDFLMVAQYLSQNPNKIIEGIVQSNNILSSNEPNKISRFWSYGPSEKLKKQAQKWKCLDTLFGSNFTGIQSLVISPDGQTLFSGGFDEIQIWQVSTGKEICTLTGHSGNVHSLAISPDGQTLFGGDWNKTIKIWQVSTGKEIRTLIGNCDSVDSLVISPDGQTLFSGAFNEIQIWQVSTGKEIRTLTGHSDRVVSLAISPDGQTLFSGSHDGTIKIWQVSTGKEIRTLTGHSGDVVSLAISPDGQTLFSGSHDGTIKIWQVSTGKEIRTLTGHSGDVTTLAINPNGQTIFSASTDKTIKIWQVSTGKEIRTLTGHSRWVASLAISSDGQTIFSCSGVQIKIWQCA
jgi:WD40 repeat protein